LFQPPCVLTPKALKITFIGAHDTDEDQTISQIN
jgi:hypothetical protein